MDIVMSEQVVSITMLNEDEDGDDSDSGTTICHDEDHDEDHDHTEDRCFGAQEAHRLREIGVYLRKISQQFEDQRRKPARTVLGWSKLVLYLIEKLEISASLA